jgi:hypothetical protein
MYTPLQEQAEALEILAPAIREMRVALDHGVSFADSTLDERPGSAYTWATLVRYEARNHLRTVVDGASWSLNDLPNCGLEVVQARFVMRALKKSRGGPPNPGKSSSRRNYYLQRPHQGVLPLEWDATVEPEHGANLLLDWSLDLDQHLQLALSKPMGLWKYRGHPILRWRRVLTDEGDVPRFVPAVEDVPVDFRFELGELDAEDLAPGEEE